MDDVRDLQQQLAAMQATNAALAAQRAAQDARIVAMQAELSTTRASEATVRAAADACFTDAFKGARPERCMGRLSWRSGCSMSGTTPPTWACRRTSACSMPSPSWAARPSIGGCELASCNIWSRAAVAELRTFVLVLGIRDYGRSSLICFTDEMSGDFYVLHCTVSFRTLSLGDSLGI